MAERVWLCETNYNILDLKCPLSEPLVFIVRMVRDVSTCAQFDTSQQLHAACKRSSWSSTVPTTHRKGFHSTFVPSGA